MAIATSDKKVATAAWISLAVSALTTGFASATISYDFDTDPVKRAQVPDFYGYIPAKASKRILVFVSMVLLTVGMLLIRCTTIVLLGLVGGRWVAFYIGADMGLYLVVKLLRGDFWYWAPFGGNAEIVSSILMRVIVKVITDFTSIVQFRHPNEVGGIHWVLGFILSTGSLPVAVISAGPQLSARAVGLAWAVVMYFIPLSFFSSVLFFSNIERQYWQTFWSTQKGKDYTMSSFLESESAAVRIRVFKMSRHHWVSIEDSISKWVEENWERWENDKPEWFTGAMKAKVPNDFIPTAGEARRRESARRASVDAEADGGLGGGLRASIRRASIGGVNEQSVRVSPKEEDNNC
jgi:hypothetical protein